MCLRNIGWFAGFGEGEGQGKLHTAGARAVGESALLPFSLAFTQEGGCALTSSFWAWREPEEQKQRGDGLSTQLN